MDGLNPLTSTEDLKSGIAPIPSGNFKAIAKLFSDSRSVSFYKGHLAKYSGTEVASPFVPHFTKDPAGEEIARQTTGTGQFVMDPMEHLEQKVDIDHAAPRLSYTNSPDTDADYIRRKGLSAYRKVYGQAPSRRFQGGHQF